jgi:DNA polymerase-3 subunit epsilon
MKYSWLKARRWLMSRKHFSAPFDAFLEAELPASSAAFKDVEFVSLDIETTGLDASNADMLSVGWVIIRHGKIDLRTAESYIVRPSGDVGDSASVHGLTDTVVGAGLGWVAALGMIVEVLTGRILLVHHAGLDKALLDRMCVNSYGSRLLVPVVERKHHIETRKALRLSDLREAYNLPRYNAHDCLVDAIATAELLIAIAAHRGDTSLGELLE